MPHSWYHVCMGLDTVSGLLRIVVNGREVVNEEKDYFQRTADWKPKSVAGKIIVLKGYLGGFWYQFRGAFSNMNIFSSMLSVEDMVGRTSGGEDCSSPGDYLGYLLNGIISVFWFHHNKFSWTEMEWEVSGAVTSGAVDTLDTVITNICARSEFKFMKWD